MFQHAAFLRGMNVGGHRITNEELRSHIESFGFTEVQTFRASGNVVFSGGAGSDQELQARLEQGLQQQLGYAVPTFIRSAKEMRALAQSEPFDLSGAAGKLQVALLAGKPAAAARREVLALASERDQLAFSAKELFWLPDGPMSDSQLDWKVIERLLGPPTVRTKGTIEQIAGRYFSPA